MKNFLKIAEGVDVTPMNMALALHPELWNVNDLRTAYADTPHAAADDIWLRFNPFDPVDSSKIIDAVECINYAPFIILPEARPLIFGLMARVSGERLGRCIIAKLKPGGCITPHRDQGSPATYYERFHILLKATPGVMFHSGDESVQMRTVEVWWFDNSEIHSVENNSADERISIIVDIKVSK